MLQERFLPDAVKARTIPEWGKRIFSPLCVCIAPKTQEDLVGRFWRTSAGFGNSTTYDSSAVGVQLQLSVPWTSMLFVNMAACLFAA